MPFRSKKQMRWMFANHPEMAKKWADHTPDAESLPELSVEDVGDLYASLMNGMGMELAEESGDEPIDDGNRPPPHLKDMYDSEMRRSRSFVEMDD